MRKKTAAKNLTLEMSKAVVARRVQVVNVKICFGNYRTLLGYCSLRLHYSLVAQRIARAHFLLLRYFCEWRSSSKRRLRNLRGVKAYLPGNLLKFR